MDECVRDPRNALATDDLDQAIRGHRGLANHLCGVFARDELLHHRCQGRYPRLHVVNTDPSTAKGSHWILYVRHRPYIVKVYDSYARHPRVYGKDLWHYLRTLCKGGRVLVHPFRYQALDSIVCGYYTLYFSCLHIHPRRHKLPRVHGLTTQVKHINSANDVNVLQWGRTYFPSLVHLCENTPHQQSCQPQRRQ